MESAWARSCAITAADLCHPNPSQCQGPPPSCAFLAETCSLGTVVFGSTDEVVYEVYRPVHGGLARGLAGEWSVDWRHALVQHWSSEGCELTVREIKSF